MISRFFIDRPIAANVIAIITVIFGVAALYQLPVERYPQITPPTVQVSTNYPGANAKVVADTVAAPIEQQINGVENMMYMSSTSSSDGSYGLTITFEIGTNLEDAQVLVQNRLSIAEPTLPEEVRRQGVTVKKQSSNIVLAISLTAPPPKSQFDITLDPAGLADAGATPEDVLKAAAGAGAEFRPHLDLTLDPDGLKRTGATGGEVLRALDGAGAEFRPHPDDKPGRYRITAPLAFPSDGPAAAEQFRGLPVTPANRPAGKLADLARVEPVPGFYRVTVPDDFAENGPAGVERLRRLAVKPTVPLVDVAQVDTLPGAYDGLFLSNYATLKLRDELSRVEGVGDVMIRGVGAYAMRIWIDPDRLAARQLTTQDVIGALARHNVQVAAGQVGQPPNPSGQRFQLTVTTLGRLSDESQFRDIVLKSGVGGQPVYLRDVAEVTLGAQTYDSFSSRSGFSAANILIYQLPGSNAIEVSQGVRRAMERLKPTLPPGMDYSIPFDTTKFVSAAIDEVYITLAEAGMLVLIVILVFLQSWRALLVPATTVPITLIGAFAFMPFLGFSINLLTLFGLVLAIGIVVDDAIVIVENASHHIERGMNPRSATIRAMNEVTGPVISITLVLMAVFIPTAFLPGITGEMYRQFALTIAATAFISAINALTLKPAQCAVWLRPVTKKGRFSRAFDAVYRPIERGYSWSVRQLLRVWWIVLVVFLALALLTAWWYDETTTSFLPEEDQGYLVIAVQLPDAASLDRTRELEQKLNRVLRETPGVENWFVLGGFSLLDGTAAPNAATAFIAWKDWKYRKSPELSYLELKKRVDMEFAQMREAVVFSLVPPSIQGLGFAGGFQLQVEDREGVGLDALQERAQALWDAARQRSDVLAMRPLTFRAGVPQIYLDIDREKAEKMGVKLDDVFRTLQANLGSVYVNDFNIFGRTYQVRVQADASFRGDTNTIKRLEVPGREGMVDAEGNPLPRPRVPLGTLLSTEVRVGPQSIMRYNLYPFASLQGSPAEGVSSGQALQEMEQLADRMLPATMGHEWTGIAYQEKRVGSEAIMVFGLAVLLVYLVLSFLYESWLLPFAVILVVPLGLLGVVAAVNFRAWAGESLPGSWLDGWLPWTGSMDNNIYTQIGVVLIIALASKNAILIVEFARELRLAGKPIHVAAAEAAKMRFRPIIMTSFAFILGVLPLVFATGAGAASRQSLGTAVCGGMLTATVLAVFFVPVFYVAIQSLIELRNGPPKPPGEPGALPVAEPIAEDLPPPTTPLPATLNGEPPAPTRGGEDADHEPEPLPNGSPDGPEESPTPAKPEPTGERPPS